MGVIIKEEHLESKKKELLNEKHLTTTENLIVFKTES